MDKKLFILDAHPVVVTGIQRALGGLKGVIVMGFATKVSKALRVFRRTMPDIIVLDPCHLSEFPAALIQQIIKAVPDASILVFSKNDCVHYEEACLAAGAFGFLSKSKPVEKFLQAVQDLVIGKLVCSLDILERLVHQSVATKRRNRNEQEVARKHWSLSPREQEVFELIGRGLSSREIGKTLDISYKTIDVHKSNIRARLGLSKANHVAREAILWVRGGGV